MQFGFLVSQCLHITYSIIVYKIIGYACECLQANAPITAEGVHQKVPRSLDVGGWGYNNLQNLNWMEGGGEMAKSMICVSFIFAPPPPTVNNELLLVLVKITVMGH